MDCGISFGFNKWALASGLGLLSLGGYETYQLAIKPVSTGRHFSMELMEYKVPEEVSPLELPVLETMDGSEEIIDSQPEMETIPEPIAPIVEAVEEETEELTPNVEPEVSVEEEVISNPTPPIPEEPIAIELVKEDPVVEVQKVEAPKCLFTFRNSRSRSVLGADYRSKVFCIA